MPGPSPKTVQMPCSNCGAGKKNHDILREYEDNWSNEESHGWSKYYICQCKGCEGIRFRVESWDSSDYDPNRDDEIISVRIYPELTPLERRTPVEIIEFPEKVGRIYRETVNAYNVGALTLAGGGLRAIVEAICLDRGAAGSRLVEKIDDLVTKGLLAKPQAELLHEERYIGNAALHEISLPSRRDIEDGLDIVETLLTTIYILPGRAEQLKNRRAAKIAGASSP